MTTRTRRTPEQLAKYYQEKADKAKAKADALAQQKELNELIALGKLAKERGLGGADEAGSNRVLEILGKGLVGKALDGLVVGGSENLAGLRKLLAAHLEPAEWAEFAEWWKAQGHPEE